MSTTPQQVERKRPTQPKEKERGTLPHGSKDQEIENIKRLLANISQRIDKLR